MAIITYPKIFYDTDSLSLGRQQGRMQEPSSYCSSLVLGRLRRRKNLKWPTQLGSILSAFFVSAQLCSGNLSLFPVPPYSRQLRLPENLATTFLLADPIPSSLADVAKFWWQYMLPIFFEGVTYAKMPE